MNVIQPALFAAVGLVGMGMRLAAAAQYSSEAARAAASRDTLRDRFSARRRRAQSPGSLAARFRLNAERAYQDLLVLIPPAEGLDKLLRDVESF